MALPFAAGAETPCGEWAERIGHGAVMWTDNAVLVQGTASPGVSRHRNRSVAAIKRMAQRAATLDAYRKAAALLAGVRITSEIRAGDDVQTLSAVQAHVRQATICRAKYFADGGVDMVVRVPLAGMVTPAVLGSVGTEVAAGPSEHTGLVIDAAGVAFAPSMAPTLLSPEGRVLFSERSVARDVFADRGAVRYLSATDPLPADLVGDRPLTAAAVDLGPGSPGELVLDPAAAEVLAGRPAFLGEGKVAIRIADPASPPCEDLAAGVQTARVDWERRLVLARGKGKVDFSRDFDTPTRLRMMERAAEVDAQQNLLRAFSAVALEGERTAEELRNAPGSVSGLVLNAIRCGARYFRDGSAEIVLAAPLDGFRVAGMGRPAAAAAVSQPPQEGPTGLIVDAAGLAFTPAVAPRLLAPDGSTVYSHFAVSKAWIDHYGAAGYRETVEAARTDPRAGDRPMTVRAVRSTGLPGELMLSAPDAEKVLGLGSARGVFSRGRVIIVMD